MYKVCSLCAQESSIVYTLRKLRSLIPDRFSDYNDSMQIDWVPIVDLKPDPKNRNKHSPEQITRLVKLINYQGWRWPIVVSKQDGRIKAGHGRLLAAKQMGLQTVPVSYQDFLTEEQAKAFQVSDNEISRWAELDLPGLNEDIGGLGPDFDLELLGLENFTVDVADKLSEEIETSEPTESSIQKSEEELEEIPEKIESISKSGNVFRIGSHRLYNGDCLEVLKRMPDNHVDSLITDPPAGIAFMGKEWDEDKGGSKEWVKWLNGVMKEALRVMKPGAHGLVWAIPRTSHWTATALEDAGFEIRDVVTHIFSTGFPKASALNRQKSGVFCQCALDKHSIDHTSDAQRPGDHNNNQVDVSDDDLPHKDVQHLTDKLSNSQADYQQSYGSSDALAHFSSKSALVASPQQQCAQGHSHSVVHEDVEACESFDSLSLVQCKNLHANKDYSSLSKFPTDVSSDKPLNIRELESKPIQTGNAISADHKQHNSSQSSAYGTALPNCGHCDKPIIDGCWYNGGLKPASEHWVLVRKPCSEDTVAKNVLKHGTGGINIDASRIRYKSEDDRKSAVPFGDMTNTKVYGGNSLLASKTVNDKTDRTHTHGRFPANLVLSHNEDCVEVGMKKVKATSGTNTGSLGKNGIYSHAKGLDKSRIGMGDEDGTETVAAFECTEGCAVAMLDEQSGVSKSVANQRNNSPSKNMAMTGDNLGHISFSDSGGASRFFYCAKASKSDKGKDNTHPTVKSIKLMQYLITMITPPDGTILDCFGGSGTTLVAAHLKAFSTILIEQAPEYCDIIIARAEFVTGKKAEILNASG